MTGQTLYELYLGVFRGPFPVKWAELPETSQRDWGRLSDAVFNHLGMGVRISISDPKPAFPIPAGSRIDIDFKGIGGSVSSLVPPTHDPEFTGVAYGDTCVNCNRPQMPKWDRDTTARACLACGHIEERAGGAK